MTDLKDFIECELYPAVFARADLIFHEMELRPYRGGWATHLKLNGEPSHDHRKEKSVITRKKPQRILEQGGESLPLIDFYMRLRGKTFIEAVQGLAAECGLEPPKREDSEQYKAYRKKQESLEAINSRMIRDLYSEEGKSVLQYLQGTGEDERGYSGQEGEDFIRYAEFGYCSKKTADELRSLLTFRDTAGQEVCSCPSELGKTYLLSMPYRSGGRIQGFVFRTIIKGLKPKYKDAFISATASKKYHLFGLTGLKLTGDAERDRDITVVEGEIDALRASFADVPNVTAAAGGILSPEALKEAKTRGVRRVTLLFDTEATKEDQEKTLKKAKNAIENIEKGGLKACVCFLPQEEEGKKMDADAFLKNHTGEELKSVILEADPASFFLFDRIAAEHEKREEKEGQLNNSNFDDYKRETIELCNKVPPVERELILRRFSERTGKSVSVEAIREEADLEKALRDRNRQKRETLDLAAEAYNLAQDGKTDEALSLMSEKTEKVRRISLETGFTKLLRLPTAADIRQRLRNKPAGQGTLYAFGYGDKRTQLLLPSGALTYICAPTSHGKSRMMQNLALQLAEGAEGGDVLYFSFEEDAEAVSLELLNIYLNMNLSLNNLRSLSSYYRTGGRYFSRNTNLKEFERKEKAFLSLMESGKLRIYYEDYDARELIEAIRYLAGQTRIKAVFVDYVQALSLRNTRLQRKDELKEICQGFMKVSVETGIPIVLGAQLNREALSPIEMAVQNIADASDIEHSANIVMLLWNSSAKALAKSSYYVKDKLSKEAQEIEGKGFHIGTPGKLYVTLAKNRGGERNIDAVLDFNGNTGKIMPNFSPKEETQGRLSFDTDQEDSGDNPF